MSIQTWNKVNLFIAHGHLMARKKQSILAVLGVVFGVATFIVLLGFMTGVNDFLDDAVFKGNPDLVLSRATGNSSLHSINPATVHPIKSPEDIENILSEDFNTEAFSRQILTPAILISGQQFATQIQGVDPDQEKAMVDLDRRLTVGLGFQSLKRKSTILLGSNLARQLELNIGDKVGLVLPNRKRVQLEVSGIFSFGISTIDNYRAYMHISRLDHLLSKKPLTTHIHVKLKDREDLSLKLLLEKGIDGIRITDWKEGNRTIVVGNRVRHILTWSISVALLLVAGFGIFNILNITVFHKRKDIAVLKTMGYRADDIIAIFSMQSAVIGLVGSVAGIILGYWISLGISNIPLDTKDFIIADTYPVNFKPWFYVVGFLFGILTAIISGYFPARKAISINPVKIIRGI